MVQGAGDRDGPGAERCARGGAQEKAGGPQGGAHRTRQGDLEQGDAGFFHSFESSVVDPDQIKIRIWIEIYKLDPDPDQFADAKPKCMKYEPILALFQGFEPFFEARIWIRIRITVIS